MTLKLKCWYCEGREVSFEIFFTSSVLQRKTVPLLHQKPINFTPPTLMSNPDMPTI